MAKKRKQQSSAPATTETQIDTSQQSELEIKEEQEPTVNPSVENELNEEEQNDDVEEEPEEVEEEEEEEKVNGNEQNGGIEGVEEVSVSAEGENDVVLEDEPLEKILEPFGKDQLIVLLKQAVDKHPDLMESVLEIADADPAHRKIFVHGLGWDATADILKEAFGKYGEIEDCKVVTNRVSGKSKGYAFILFKHRIGARKALKEPQKMIGTRMTSCQLATMGPVPAPPPIASPVSEYTQRKIFVSNVSPDADTEKLLEFFKQFGEIEEGPLGLDKQTGKPKGFALFVYKSVESAKKALEQPHKDFEGLTLHCQKAVDGPRFNKQGSGTGGSGHHSQQHHHYQHSAKKGKYLSGGSGGGGGHGHLMAPAGPGAAYNPGVPAQGFNPMLGQALTALIATQGNNLGLGNLIGGLAPVNPGMPNMGYGSQPGYGNQAGMQGGYGSQGMNPQMGQGGGARPYQGGAPYIGQ